MVESSPETLLLASLPQGLVAGNRQRQITAITPAAARLLALDVDRWLWQPIDAFCAHYDIPALEALSEQKQAIYTNRQKLYVQVLTLPQASARAGLGFAILLSPEDAEHRAMANLITTISHEARTPLTVIRGFSELLLRGLAGPMDVEQQEIVEAIRRHASNTTRLINNAIIIAGLDAGTIRTDREPADPKCPIEDALYPLHSLIETKGLSLTVDLPNDLPQILVDVEQVRMAIYQLLDNALRYTSAGGITVRAIARAEAVLVEVVDTGRGIAPEMQPRLFERFVRWGSGSDGVMAAERGIGLGLAICKQLVERQGGTIWATSTPGQGSCFSIALPTAA
jgi:signal transduction histidine kinase